MTETKTNSITDKDFLEKRILFMEGDFDEKSCEKLAKEILYLSTHNEKEPVTLFIDSYGGGVYELMRIYSLLTVAPFKLTTTVVGKAMSAGAYLLLMGDTRIAYPYSTIMLHEIAWGSGYAKLHDHTAHHKESERMQKIIIDIVSENTKIKNASEYLKVDKYLSPQEAKKLGVIDKIL